MADFTTWDAGGEKVAVRKDLRVPMRDGVELAADVYHGIEDKPRPALVALSPYGKELQALALTTPSQRRPSPMWDGCIEAGDIARVVKEDYAHVIGDLRGSGDSGDEMIGNYNAGGVPLGQDAYDFIEWVAEQPWCDGNVGMIGISYFGSMQVLAARDAVATPVSRTPSSNPACRRSTRRRSWRSWSNSGSPTRTWPPGRTWCTC